MLNIAASNFKRPSVVFLIIVIMPSHRTVWLRLKIPDTKRRALISLKSV
jgi:hypothetical protein